jgi:disulfide oxidoreductase YuzD
MGFSKVIKNKFDNKDYRISIVSGQKRTMSIPNAFNRDAGSNESLKMMGQIVSEPEIFDSIIFEAAVFNRNSFPYKPLFSFEYNGIEQENTEEKFKKFICDIMENEKIDDLINFQDESNNIYRKYGFMATRWDIWQLAFLSKIRFIFISAE